jgi:putative FmdB family regulatory protein
VLNQLFFGGAMPTYDYQCSKCGHRFEEFQSMKADPLKTCPQCSTDSLRRLIGSGAGLIFKGNGFYITDYKNNGNGQSASKADDGKKETAKDSSAKAGSAEKKKDAAA